jgi:PAS domain S-box-containing protein
MARKGQTDRFKTLRKKAERKLRYDQIPLDLLDKEQALKAVHELRVHQVELQMQNEQLRQTQIELEESRNKFTDLFDFAPTGYFVVDPKGHILEVNLTGASMVGRERNFLAGKPFVLFVGTEDKDRFFLSRRNVLQTRTRERCDLKILNKDGYSFFAELLMDPVLDAEGQVTHCRIALIDITERKKAEELRQYQIKAKAMASAVRKGRQRERAELAVGLHDSVGQKLFSVKLIVESVLRSISDDEHSASLTKATELIGDIIRQVRSMTFGLSNPILWEFGFVPALEDYLTEEIQNKHGLSVELDADGTPVVLRDDVKACLFSVTRELLMNVVRHARARTVRVTVRQHGSQIRVAVKDDGVGFEPEEMEAKGSMPAHFGLFDIREQLEDLGGQLRIESQPGRGTEAMVVVG